LSMLEIEECERWVKCFFYLQNHKLNKYYL
jgi:hypothetical protein